MKKIYGIFIRRFSFVIAVSLAVATPSAWGAGSCVKNWNITDLGTLGGDDTRATALNENGQVTGQSKTVSGETHVFLWDNGSLRDLGTLGGPNSRAEDINNKGEIVGGAELSYGNMHAFVYRN